MATKQYKLIHLGTGEQVFGIHSKAWFDDRLSKWDIYLIYHCREGSPARWQWYKKVDRSDIAVSNSARICNSIEFELFEVKDDK